MGSRKHNIHRDKILLRPVCNGIDIDAFAPPNRTVLIVRRFGGAGDILMTRPIFTAIKQRQPSITIHYAIPRKYIPLVIDHPDIDFIIPYEKYRAHGFKYAFDGDISRACINHEIAMRGNVNTQRMDLWADELGISLEDRGAHFNFTSSEVAKAKDILDRNGVDPERFFLISPHSVAPSRNLLNNHVESGVRWAEEHGLQPCIVHHSFIEEYPELIQINDILMREWMVIVSMARMVYTTDTATLHLAGFLGRPTVALFNYTSGSVVSKHYPSVVPVQVSRKELECCPCYNWGACKFLPETNGKMPLKCFSMISEDMIVDALDSCFLQEESEPTYDLVEKIDWSKTIELKDPKKETGGVQNHVVLLYTGHEYTGYRNSMSVVAIISALARAIRSKNRNTVVHVVTHTEISKFLIGDSFVDSFSETYLPSFGSNIDVFDIDFCLRSNLSVPDYFLNHFNLNIRDMEVRLNLEEDIVNQYKNRPPYFAVMTLDDFNEWGIPRDEVRILAEHSLEERMAILKHAKFIVTDCKDTADFCCLLKLPTFIKTNEPKRYQGYRTEKCISLRSGNEQIRSMLVMHEFEEASEDE